MVTLIELIDEEVFDNAKSLEEVIKRWEKLKTHLKEVWLSSVKQKLMI